MKNNRRKPGKNEEKKNVRKDETDYCGTVKCKWAEIKPETKFKDDLGADSLDLFELVMALEEEFGIEIPSEDLENIVTVNDIMGYLKEKGVEA